MLLPALVTIKREHVQATGFVIEKGLVVTAYHVTPQGHELTVIYPNGERASVVEYVAFDAAKDLAVLRTNAKGIPHTLRLAASSPSVGTRVAALRLGDGELFGTVTEISTSKIAGRAADCDMLLTTLNAVPGWSGGPVVNMQGEVVGVTSRLDGSSFDAQGLKIATGTAAVSVSELKQLLATVKTTAVVDLDSIDLEHRRERAARYFSKGDFEKAIKDYTELILLQPERAEVFYDRARAYTEKGEFEKAIADYTRAIARKADFVDAYAGRAAARESSFDRDGAISDYLTLIGLLPKNQSKALEPKLIEAYKGRARALASAGEFDKAIADLSAVIRLRPGDVDSLAVRAWFYGGSGQFDKALADYADAIRLKPNDAALYRCCGIVRAKQGDHERAMADIAEAIRLYPGDAENYCARGAVYGGLRDYKKAIADFAEAIRLDPTLAKAYFDRGSAYKAQGNEAEANADFERAKRLGYR